VYPLTTLDADTDVGVETKNVYVPETSGLKLTFKTICPGESSAPIMYWTTEVAFPDVDT